MNIYLTVAVIVISAVPFLIPRIPKLFNHFTTIFHEVGHALFTLLTRGQVKAIRVHPDGSGDTLSAQDMRGYYFSRIIVLLSGYAFPILVGLTGGLSVYYQNYMIGFWLIVAVSLISIIFIRNLFGFAIVLIYGAIVALSYFVLQDYLPYIIVFLSGLAFFGGVRDLVTISGNMFSKHATDGSDFSIMKETLHIPKRIGVVLEWSYVLVLGTITFLIFAYFNGTISF
jgi:hypothetical protein